MTEAALLSPTEAWIVYDLLPHYYVILLKRGWILKASNWVLREKIVGGRWAPIMYSLSLA